MDFVANVEVTEARLGASNVTDTEALWLVGTTYAEGDIVRGPTGFGFRLYRAVQGVNTGHNPGEDVAETWWEDIGATNRAKMFDGSTTSQTVNAESIEVTVTPGVSYDTVAFCELDAASVQVVVDDPDDGVVFDETFNLINDDGINDWEAYYRNEVRRKRDLIVQGLPTFYSSAAVEASINAPGGTAKCGSMMIGPSYFLGGTQYGARVGIIDFSRKEPDEFGDYQIVELAYSAQANFTLYVADEDVDFVYRLLASYRAKAALFIGSTRHGVTAVWGFARDFNVEISQPDVSICSLEVEGMNNAGA